jgi:hypothetical protein
MKDQAIDLQKSDTLYLTLDRAGLNERLPDRIRYHAHFADDSIS